MRKIAKNGIQYISIMVDSHKGETIREQSKRGATKRCSVTPRKILFSFKYLEVISKFRFSLAKARRDYVE